MNTSIYAQNENTTLFPELHACVHLLNEPSRYNYLGVILEKKLSRYQSDKGSKEYNELIELYQIFQKFFMAINNGARWKAMYMAKGTVILQYDLPIRQRTSSESDNHFSR